MTARISTRSVVPGGNSDCIGLIETATWVRPFLRTAENPAFSGVSGRTTRIPSREASHPTW